MSSRANANRPAATPDRVTRSMTRPGTPGAARPDRLAPGTAGTATPRRRTGPHFQTPLPSIPGRTNTAFGADGSPGLQDIPDAVAPNPDASIGSVIARRTADVVVITSRRNRRPRPCAIPEEPADDGVVAPPDVQDQPVSADNDTTDNTITRRREYSAIHRANNGENSDVTLPPVPEYPDEAVPPARVNVHEDLPPPPEPSEFRIAWEIVKRNWFDIALFVVTWLVVTYLMNNREQLKDVFVKRSLQVQDKVVSMWSNVQIPTPTFVHPDVMPSIPTSLQNEPIPPVTSEDVQSDQPTSTSLSSGFTGDFWTKERTLEVEALMRAAMADVITPGAQKDLYGRLDKLEKDVSELKNKLGLHDATLAKLQEILPHTIVVRKGQDGEFEIPDQFWKALSSKITKDYALKPSDSTDDWELFWAQNWLKLHNYFETEFDARLNKVVDGQHAISQQMFSSLLEKKWKQLSEEVREHNSAVEAAYKSLQSEILASAARTAREESHRTVQEAIWSLPDEQLEILARANDIQNAWRAANSINFFSPGLGAIIDPHMTTPTKKKPDNVFQIVYKWLAGMPRANKPVNALMKWDEATDCWCGAGMGNDGLGRIQLGVHMKHKLWPRKVTIEHISAAGTLDIGAAPRHMELWAEIKDIGLRASVNRAIRLQGLVCEGGFDEKYVCLGAWKYNIHGLNNVQTFPLDVDLKTLGVEDGATDTVVRVLSNWGRDYTCIYRARMHGELARLEESLK